MYHEEEEIQAPTCKEAFQEPQTLKHVDTKALLRVDTESLRPHPWRPSSRSSPASLHGTTSSGPSLAVPVPSW